MRSSSSLAVAEPASCVFCGDGATARNGHGGCLIFGEDGQGNDAWYHRVCGEEHNVKTFHISGPLKPITAPKPPPIDKNCIRCGRVTTWEPIVDPDAPERTIAHRCTVCGVRWRHDRDRPSNWTPGGPKHPRRR